MLRGCQDEQGHKLPIAGGASARSQRDLGLPAEDGLSLARLLRENYDIGIIMVSGAGHFRRPFRGSVGLPPTRRYKHFDGLRKALKSKA